MSTCHTMKSASQVDVLMSANGLIPWALQGHLDESPMDLQVFICFLQKYIYNKHAGFTTIT